jgi:hypothetical protein
MDDEERRKIWHLPGLELRSLGRPARSQSLYRLRYAGYYKGDNTKNLFYIIIIIIIIIIGNIARFEPQAFLVLYQFRKSNKKHFL